MAFLLFTKIEQPDAIQSIEMNAIKEIMEPISTTVCSIKVNCTKIIDFKSFFANFLRSICDASENSLISFHECARVENFKRSGPIKLLLSFTSSSRKCYYYTGN